MKKIYTLPRPPQPTEHSIQTAIINYLGYLGYYVQRLNSGAVRTPTGGLVRLAAKGTPDIMAFKKCPMNFGEEDVHLFFIEVKRPGKKATFNQEHMMKELEAHGAKCIIATSVEDLEEQL